MDFHNKICVNLPFLQVAKAIISMDPDCTWIGFATGSFLVLSNKIRNAGGTMIDHPVGNGCKTTYVWEFGGWFIIVLPTLL